MNTVLKSVGIIVITTGLSACAGMSNTESGTLIGAGTGAVAGGVITGGNPIGVIGGAAVGGIIGHEVGADRDGYRRR